eukprot:9492951-Pyramimonas_sp.AAC.1
MADYAARCVHQCQRGFVRGRQLLDNVFQLDDAGAAFLDVKAAFPSISHERVFAVLEAAQFPSWYVHVVKNMYSGVCMRARFRGRQDQWFFLGAWSGTGLPNV